MTVRKPKPLLVYSDASVYCNGQRGLQDAFYAVVVDDGSKDGVLVIYKHLGDASVNEGEYHGVLAALQWIAQKDIDIPVVVITDSQLVYQQVYGFKECNSPVLRILRDRTRVLLHSIDAKLMWKSRKRNLAGFFFQRIVEQKRKEKYRLKKERKRAKRQIVRKWTIENPELSGYRTWDALFTPMVQKPQSGIN